MSTCAGAFGTQAGGHRRYAVTVVIPVEESAMPTYRRLIIAWFFVPMHRILFRLSRGRILGRLEGEGVLILVTRGRKSGRLRSSPLMYFQFEEAGDLDRRRFELWPGPPSGVVPEHRRRPERFSRNQRRALRRGGPHNPGRRTHRAVRQGGCGEFTLRRLRRRYGPPDPSRRAVPRLAAHSRSHPRRPCPSAGGDGHNRLRLLFSPYGCRPREGDL